MALFSPHNIDWRRLSTVHGGQFARSKVHWRSKSVLCGTPLALQQSYNLSGVTNVFLGENSLRCIGKRNEVLSNFATHFSDTIFSVLFTHFTPSVSIEYTLHYYTQKLHLKQKKTRAHHFYSDTFSSFYFFPETPNFCCDILLSGRSRSVSLSASLLVWLYKVKFLKKVLFQYRNFEMNLHQLVKKYC